MQAEAGLGDQRTIHRVIRQKVRRLCAHSNLFETERAAGSRKVHRQDMHVVAEGNCPGGKQLLFTVENDSQRAICQAW